MIVGNEHKSFTLFRTSNTTTTETHLKIDAHGRACIGLFLEPRANCLPHSGHKGAVKESDGLLQRGLVDVGHVAGAGELAVVGVDLGDWASEGVWGGKA